MMYFCFRVILHVGLVLFMVSCDTKEEKDGVPPVDSGDIDTEWACQAANGEKPDFLKQLGCRNDFVALASLPISAEIPGALSTKVVIDRSDEHSHYFQNSVKYPIHYDFASAHLSGNGLPIVPPLSEFNLSEYSRPDRRFILGALTYYEGPDVWAYELAPYDKASPDMVKIAYELIAANTYFGEKLKFHPTSQMIEQMAKELPDSVSIITTDEIFADVTYQPLNLGTSYGQLRFVTANQLHSNEVYVGFRDIVVLDAVPNDISVVSGIVTAAFQTPLSHINVLSQNRGTPNMALRDVYKNEKIRALEGKWVTLTVGPFDYEVVETTKEEADKWWELKKPPKIHVPALNLDTTELTNIEDILDPKDFDDPDIGLKQAVRRAIPAFGGKVSHYAAFPHMNNESVPYPKAFAIPVYYYWQFMTDNGLLEKIDQMLADETFINDPAKRDKQLEALRDEIKTIDLNSDLEEALITKLRTEYPGIRMRFRSSTNAEDLEGFTGAGLYTSKSGDPDDPQRPVADAVRTVWASVWNFRAFEERAYRTIDHKSVGMSVLVHRSFPDEEANGVAVTANIFDTSGMMPGYYVNVQVGDMSVVQPPPGITTDQFVLQYDMNEQPIIFIGNSNRVTKGETVLTRGQTLILGKALKEIHQFFSVAYGPSTPKHFYAMDIEFKFDGDPGEEPALFVKQARPYPGWNSSN